jgi:hypothetical protein
MKRRRQVIDPCCNTRRTSFRIEWCGPLEIAVANRDLPGA